MKKRILAIFLVVAIFLVTGCSSNGKNDGGEEKGKVYYLNFKSEIDKQWQELAKKYTELTGVEVKVVTAGSGTYEQTLKSEMAKKDAPTLFQVNGPIGYQSWKNYCLDLKDTKLYSWMSDQSLAIKGEDGGVYGIPYIVEGYGLIYNDAIMQKYFKLSNAKVTSIDEIKNFDTFKKVVEDMQARKSELGIDGVFGSTSLMPGEEWRWTTHLANIPVYNEYKDKNVNDTDKLEFTHGKEFKNIFDLYINNSAVSSKLLGSESVESSLAQFALGKVAMVQNGNWGWNPISAVQGNTVLPENVKFMPIYTGAKGEEKQGLNVGTENYFSINKKSSDADRKATIEFVEWLFSSKEGKDAMVNTFGFIPPFTTFEENEKPSDPLAKELMRYMENKDLESIPWIFTTFPSQQFKDAFGAALLEYASGSKTWEEVEKVVITNWASEKEALK